MNVVALPYIDQVKNRTNGRPSNSAWWNVYYCSIWRGDIQEIFITKSGINIFLSYFTEIYIHYYGKKPISRLTFIN